MSSDFEEKFVNDIQNESDKSVKKTTNQSSHFNKIAIVTVLALVLIIVIETVALVVVSSNKGRNDEVENPEEVISDSELGGDFTNDNSYTYDESDNLISFDLSCTSKNNARYVFTKLNNYEEYDSNNTKIKSGTYEIIHDGIVLLKATNNSEQVLYFDGFDIAKGTDFYTCKSNREAN
ncbi:hypothetical protein J6X15_02175 [Candidatus Saccharibacteria bacterium]|nr:hypothetical protein [Candidatus Saccharibacteria bacterium]